jgi:hypothetical protein
VLCCVVFNCLPLTALYCVALYAFVSHLVFSSTARCFVIVRQNVDVKSLIAFVPKPEFHAPKNFSHNFLRLSALSPMFIRYILPFAGGYTASLLQRAEGEGRTSQEEIDR